MPVQLRVDDFLFTKVEEYRAGRHTVEAYREFDAVLPRKYLLGVIPNNIIGHAGKYTDLHKVVPGLHGYFHHEIPSHPDEFVGMNTDSIMGCLERGIECLVWAGFKQPTVYMPPHNVINLQTVIACKDMHFTAITGGPETNPTIPAFVKNQGMVYIPSMPMLEYGRSDELLVRGAVEHLRCESETRMITLGLHWTWETNIGLDNLRRFIGEISDLLVDFTVPVAG